MDMHDLYVEIFGVCLYHGCSWSQATDAARAAVAFFDQDYGVGVANDADVDVDGTEHDTVPAPASRAEHDCSHHVCDSCSHEDNSVDEPPCSSCMSGNDCHWEPA